MKLYELKISLRSSVRIEPTQLQGAFYALLDWANPALAAELHELDRPKMSLYFDVSQAILVAGFCGEGWTGVFPIQEMSGADWRFGDDVLTIRSAQFGPAQPVPEKRYYTITTLSPLILRNSDRTAMLEPGLLPVLYSACRKADTRLPLDFAATLPVEISGTSEKCNYRFQVEPGFSGHISFDTASLDTTQLTDLRTALTILNVMGAGAKTAMGFGKVSVL